MVKSRSQLRNYSGKEVDCEATIKRCSLPIKKFYYGMQPKKTFVVLLNDITISHDQVNQYFGKARLNHMWVLSNDLVLFKDTIVRFRARVHFYRRDNGSIGFGLNDIKQIEIIRDGFSEIPNNALKMIT